MSKSQSTETSNIVSYLVACVSEFAKAHNISQRAAYAYLKRYFGMAFLTKHYEALHTLSIDEAVEDLHTICRRNGGGL